MKVARVDPATVDSGQVGFRLAPRINAAGRLGHPGAALRLLLTDDKDEAKALANRLEDLNRDRQAVEDRILRAAIDQVESWPEAKRRRHAYVVWGEDWHEGVIGIVASRLVERYHRPVVLIAGTDGLWKGSGRSIPAFDLHAALGACAELLERFGGHRAAAGLSILPDRLEAFADSFAAQAEGTLADEDLVPTTVVDAVIPRDTKLTLDLCEELRQLAPFGLGNPDVTLLAPECELGDLATVGEGKHLRFRVRQGGSRRRLGDRLRTGREARPLPEGGPVRRRVPPAGEPLERHGRAAAPRPAGLRRRRPVRRALCLATRAMGSPDARLPGAGDLRRARARGRRDPASPARVRGLSRAPRRACAPPRRVRIRPEADADRAAIRSVVGAAFGSRVEPDLVEAIRASDRFVPELSLVAEIDGEIVGHILVSYVDLEPDSVRVLQVAPLAVAPTRQRRGVGSALMRKALRLAEERGAPLVLVEGDPRYYGGSVFAAQTRPASSRPRM